MGSMFGSEKKQAEGAQQKAQADAEYEAAQTHEGAEGTMDRTKGNLIHTIFYVDNYRIG